jgi:hypothetical protein
MPAHRLPLAAAGALMMMSFAALADDRVPLRGLSLEQAIDVLRGEGLEVLYSDALVKPWMRIHSEPAATAPKTALDEILVPFGLRTRPAPNGVVAVIRGSRSSAIAPAWAQRSVRFENAQPSPENALLEEVVVATTRYELTRELSEPTLSLSGTDIEHVPALGDDALRAVAHLPGTATNGLTARMHVRGGEASETLMRFDGVRLYNPFHLKDFQSVFSSIDPRVVGSVQVYTGGFAPNFGDRLSGVIDIASLSAPAPLYRELNVSFFNTSLLSAGRFAQDRGEWVASFRRSNLDLWYHALQDEPGTPAYADAFAKVSYAIGPRLRLTLGMLRFNDEISLAVEDQEDRASADYRDAYHWLRLDHWPADSLRGVTVLSHARLSTDREGTTTKDGVSAGSLSDHRLFNVASIASDWRWRLSKNALLEMGGELRLARAQYDYRDEVQYALLLDTPGAPTTPERSRIVQARPSDRPYALYSAIRFGVTPRLTADAGLRWESDHVGPRFGARLQVGPDTFLRANWGRIYQAQGVDEWQASDGVAAPLPPQRADYTAVGIDRRFPGGVQVRAELYEKRLSDLRPRYENLLNPLTLVPELSPDRIRIAPDSGRARGVEVQISRKDAGPLSWWVGYSRASARERIDGVSVPRSWDQAHSLSAGFDWSRAHWTIGATLIQRSGWPTTSVTLEEGEPVPVLRAGARNSERAPLYRSVDLRVERRFAFNASSVSVFFEVANLLNRANACCSAYEIDDETGGLELEGRSYVPRIPSLGFVWQF